MNHPGGRTIWKGPSRIASLEDFIRKPRPRAKSKLSQEVQVDEGESGSTDEDNATTENASRPSTSNTQDTSIGTSDDEERRDSAIIPDTTSSIVSSSPKVVTQRKPEHHLHSNFTLPATARLQAFLQHNQSIAPASKPQTPPAQIPQSCNTTVCNIPEFLLLEKSAVPSILYDYLTEQYNRLDRSTAITQALSTKQQALGDLHALMLGQGPRSYQAKGQIIAIYNRSDREVGLMDAAIEVIHAPPGFPNQEVWLWERVSNGRIRTLVDGLVVVFWIVWQMADNHWEIVDVGQ